MMKIILSTGLILNLLFFTACNNNDNPNNPTTVASATNTSENTSDTNSSTNDDDTSSGNTTDTNSSTNNDTTSSGNTADTNSSTNDDNTSSGNTADTNSSTNDDNTSSGNTADTNNSTENNNSSIAISASAGVDKTIIINQEVTLTGITTGSVTNYSWTEGNVTLADSATYIYTGEQIGLHSLTFTVTDKEGKTVSDTININVTGVADIDKDFSNVTIPKYTYTKDYYESSKSGKWSLDYPNNKYNQKLNYDSTEKAYRIHAVEEALKSDGSRIRDGYTTRVASPNFTLTPGKNYQIVVKMKAKSFTAGQNVMITLRGPKGDTSSKWETLWNVSQANVWEEIYIPMTPSIINNPKNNTWKLTFFSSVAYGAYKSTYSSDLLISEDIDIFEVPKGRELVTTQGIDLGKNKISFESSTRKVDRLGNFYIKNSDGSWQHIFPKLIYRNTDRTDHTKLFTEYLDYGFNGVMDLSTVKHINSALDAGLTNLSLESSPPYKVVKGGEIDYKKVEKHLTDAYTIINQRGKQGSVIWHNFDNENSNVGKYVYQEWLLDFVNEHNPDTVTGGHLYPIFYLNGRKGLARSYRNNQRKVMDITGTYMGKDVHGDNKNGKKDLESKMLTQFLTPNQAAPASVIQIQKHFDKKFIPSIFYGILQGGRALSVWRDGKQKHGDTTYDFKDAYWANTFKNVVASQLDQLLPLIKEPQFTSWSASNSGFPEVRIGTRELNDEGYLILSNFANNAKTITINLEGLNVTKAVDYFTGEEISLINDNKFTFTIGAYNKGYKVIKLI